MDQNYIDIGILMEYQWINGIYPLVNKQLDPENSQCLMETSLPTPFSARVYVNLLEGRSIFPWIFQCCHGDFPQSQASTWTFATSLGWPWRIMRPAVFSVFFGSFHGVLMVILWDFNGTVMGLIYLLMGNSWDFHAICDGISIGIWPSVGIWREIICQQSLGYLTTNYILHREKTMPLLNNCNLGSITG